METRSPPSAFKQIKQLTIGRLRSLTQKLERMQRLKEYHMVMTERLAERILEEVPETPTGGGGHPLYSLSTSDPRSGRIHKDEDSL